MVAAVTDTVTVATVTYMVTVAALTDTVTVTVITDSIRVYCILYKCLDSIFFESHFHQLKMEPSMDCKYFVCILRVLEL